VRRAWRRAARSANASSETNDYVFERVVKEPGRDGASSSRRIDLYRRNSFVLEAKQSRQEKGGPKEIGQLEMPVGPGSIAAVAARLAHGTCS
jgi:hypothetical protein